MICTDCNNLNGYNRIHSMDKMKNRTDERLNALVNKQKNNNDSNLSVSGIDNLPDDLKSIYIDFTQDSLEKKDS
ncbi:MAG: hypothetical protein K6B41_11665 [Butyrivibrio sp.]|nr:hypothetical protein [Butyrivibrio sp.]